MNKVEARKVLVKAFGALDDEQRARLLRHAEDGTPICCGIAAGDFVGGEGGKGG